MVSQALQRLEVNDTMVVGEIFNITDGNPTHPDYILNPLLTVMDKMPGRKPTRTRYNFPAMLAKLVGLFFHGMSRLLGHHFRLPSWGLTWMEAHKV